MNLLSGSDEKFIMLNNGILIAIHHRYDIIVVTATIQITTKKACIFFDESQTQGIPKGYM